MYTSIRHMEPLLPSDKKGKLHDLALEIFKRSAQLKPLLRPSTQEAITDLVRTMNCYYSNLIEGHNTLPRDIERALLDDFDQDPVKRNFQKEAVAHIEVQKMMGQRLAQEPDLNIFDTEFLCWLHHEFFDRLPEELQWVESKKGHREKVIPGELRQTDVEVGLHVPPPAKLLPSFLDRFQSVYGRIKDPIKKIAVIGAAHHRLLWIHPFLDGNGRVVRLFTDASLKKAELDGYGIWTVTRGLARSKEEYKRLLVIADEHRKGELDGRSNLSEKGLEEFSVFFLKVALDQIQFMHDKLELQSMEKYIEGFVKYKANIGDLKPEAAEILKYAYLRGEITRGEALRISGIPERSARRVLKDLLDQKLLTSSSVKGPVRFAIPMEAVGYYFPQLFPEGITAREYAQRP